LARAAQASFRESEAVTFAPAAAQAEWHVVRSTANIRQLKTSHIADQWAYVLFLKQYQRILFAIIQFSPTIISYLCGTTSPGTISPEHSPSCSNPHSLSYT